MPELSYQFRSATPSETGKVATLLLEHSRAVTGLSIVHEPYGLLAYQGDVLIGAIIGKIFLNWLHLDLIWVEDSHRKQGIGRRLMEQTLAKAKESKFCGIELWTQSWQAPDFYRKLGYEEFAVLDDFAPGGKRHAFRYYINKANRPTAVSLPEIVRSQVEAYFRMHGDSLPSSGVYTRLLPLFEKPLIEVALEATNGNQIKAAKLLGLNRNTLHKKITELKVAIPKASKKLAGS